MLRRAYISLILLGFIPCATYAQPDLPKIISIQQAMIEAQKRELTTLKQKVQLQQDAANASTFSWGDSTAANSASLMPVFNKMRDSFPPGIYSCFARTTNGAHWKGYAFDLSLNYYNRSTDYPHLVKNIREINAVTSGCSGAFAISTNGTYTLVPGNCFESVNMVCKYAL